MRSQILRANGKEVTGGEEELTGLKFHRANFSYFAGPQLRWRFSSTAPVPPTTGANNSLTIGLIVDDWDHQ